MQVVQPGSRKNFNLIFNITETSTDIGSNVSYADWSLQLQSTGGSISSWGITGIVDINGVNVYNKGAKRTCGNGKTITLASGTVTIPHNDDGTKTVPFSCSIIDSSSQSFSPGNISLSGSLTLTTIPRYATVSNSIASTTETTINVNWSANATCDYVWYSLDSGAWIAVGAVNASNGSYTISNVPANTPHTVKTLVRRKDSQLQSESGTSRASTYAYPSCTSAPSFVIGNSLTLNFYNPLGRNITVTGISRNDGSTIFTGTTTGTSITGFRDTNAINNMYKSIPNAQSSGYSVRVTYGSSNIDTQGGTYSINANDSRPTFKAFTYKDTNEKVAALTGDNQVLVKDMSVLKVDISSANKMVAQKYATGSRYIATLNNLSQPGEYSLEDLTLELGTPNTSGNQTLTVTAYDSRNNSQSVVKNVTVYDYAKPNLIVDVSRLNNFEKQTTIKVSGTYSKLTINEEDKNTLNSVQYRYRETDGEWNGWNNLVFSANEGKFTCTDMVLQLDNAKSFEFEIKASDNLSEATVEAEVGVGRGIFSISADGRIWLGDQEIPQIEIIEEWDEPD